MTLNFIEWRAGEPKRRAAIEPFMRGADQISRTRPRSQTEADFLRSIGTPERLIGPVLAVADEKQAERQARYDGPHQDEPADD